jgi:hypothetical protein
MRFSCQVNDGIKRVFAKELVDQGFVTNVTALKVVPRVGLNVLEIGQIASVRQGIEVDHHHLGVLRQQAANHVGSDEPGTARDQHGLKGSRRSGWRQGLTHGSGLY